MTAVLIVAALALILILERLPPWSPWRFIETAPVWMLTAGCGMAVCCLHTKVHGLSEEAAIHQEGIEWMLEVESPPQVTAYGMNFLARSWCRKPAGGWRSLSGCVGYIRCQAGQIEVQPGDILQLRKHPESISGSRNPGGFDPRSYYRRMGATLTVSMHADDFLKISRCNLHPLREHIFRMRETILQEVRNNIRHPEAVGLAEALLIGYRGDLEKEIQKAYIDSGVVHIIAISGLHIGLLYAILSWAFEMMPFPIRLKVLQVLPPLAAIWVFTLLAGAGPSVVRSAAQCTILGIGRQLTGRRGTSLNTLASSAFILLAIRPDWLEDLGFQLSYAAVAGILLFHTRLCRLLPMGNPIGRLLRDSIAMSFAAQLFTTPIILMHFGRFPTWFLFTNMVVVPLSTCILCTVLLTCMLSPWPALSLSVGKLSETGILFMNDYIRRMGRMPLASLENIHLTLGETAAVFCCIGCAATWLIFTDNRWRTALAVSLVIMAWLHTIEWMKRSAQKLAVVWQLPRETLLLLIDGHSGYAFFRSRDTTPSASIPKTLSSAAQFYHLEELQVSKPLTDRAWEVSWRGCTFIITGRSDSPPPEPRKVDCIVLTSNTETDLRNWQSSLACERWVADGSNSLWKIQKWEEALAGLPLRFHSTPKSGAYIHAIPRHR